MNKYRNYYRHTIAVLFWRVLITGFLFINILIPTPATGRVSAAVNNELVTQGQVFLIPGTVDSTPEIDNAVNLALQTPGVALPDSQYYAITSISVFGSWRLVSVTGLSNVGPDLNWNLDNNASWIGLVLLENQGGTLEGSVEGSEEYSQMIGRIPDDILSRNAKRDLDPLQRALQAQSGYRFPWTSGTKMKYGTEGVHDNGFNAVPGASGWVAVDFLSGYGTSGEAPNDLKASAAGTVGYKCEPRNGGVTTAIKINDLFYTHLNNNSNIYVGRTYSEGESIGTLKTGSFSENCGYASQGASVFHVHLGFPNTGSVVFEDWTLSFGDGIWRKGSEAQGTNTWFQSNGGGNGIPIPSGAIWCSGEGGYCSFSGTATVYYGASNSYYKKDNVSNGINCNNDIFGDPISGVTKSCYYVLTSSPSSCPSVSGQVILYDGTNCTGAQASAGSTGLFQFDSSFNDRAESIAVPGGWSARLYVDNSESSASACIPATDSDLWNNTFSGGGTVANQTTWMRVYSNSSCSGSTPSPNGSWNARYFSGNSGWWDPSSLNNATPSCTETLSSGLDKNYGSSAPCNNGMNGDDWVGEYTTTINFPSGYYVFIADHDDGFKLWRDGSTNIAERGGSGSTDYICPAQYLSGNVNLKAMLREEGGDARIKLTWSTDTNLCISRPSAPSLQNPSDGAVYNENQATTLSWSSTGDEYYGEITGGPQALSFGWQSSTSNNIGALWAGYTYTWRVKARNSAGEGDWSSTRTFTVKPGAPSNLTASAPACNQVNLSWSDNSGNEEGYKVYRNGSLIATLGSGTTSYQDTGVSATTSYNYTVYAYRSSILSPVSNTASVTTPVCGAGVPSPVSPESGTVYDEGQPISLSWTATGTEYYGEISGGPAGTSTFGWQTATNKSIGSQWAGYVYSWRVKARNSVSTSAFSNSNTFIVRPGQPTSLTAVSPACARVSLTWADNSGNEEGYQVYRDGSYLTTVGSNVTNYQDTTAASDTSYTYTVYAYRGSIQSAVSASALVTTLVCPPSNDNIANAISISPSSLPYTNTQTSRGATLEASEPAYPVGSNLGASVWYRFTPSMTGTYSFDTSGSGYDTVLHMFERTATGTLIPVKGNDDDPDLQGTQSKLIFTGKANTTYLFSITQYYGSTGGALTVHLVSIACPSGLLCITATSPFYSSYSFWVSVYSSSGSYVTGMWLDNYGYGTISGLPSGTYQVTISGWNMLRTIQNVPSGGYLDVTGVGLPSILVALKDLTGTQIDANAYLETSTGSYYVGRSYSDRALLIYASPADYLLVQSGTSAKYLAYNDISVQSGMQYTDMTYDVSQSPAKTFTYHLQTIPSASLVLWKGNSGSSLTMNDGQTAVISFPAGKTYRMDNIVTVEDTSEYWNYEFQSRDLEMQTFREENQVSIGGNLQFTVIPNLAPYGYGDNASVSYHVKDQFGNRLMYAWSQVKVSSLQTTDLSAQGGSSSLPPVKAVTDEVGNIHYQRTSGTDMELQTLSPISSSIQLLNPSGGQAYQETQEGWYGTIYWTIPSNAPLGTWTARVTANHLGLWQGQTVGEQTFAVRDSRPPANDDFGSSQPISSMPYSISEDTFGATQAPDDPAMPSCNLSPAQATVWFRYQPAQSGTLHLDTIDSDYDTVLAVWTGAQGSLSLQGCNDDRITSPRDQDSELVIPVSRNITYYIMVGKYNGDYSQTAVLANVKSGISMQTMGAGVAQLHISFSSSLPAAAQLTSPNNGTFLVRDVSFNWNPVSVATEYYLVVQNSAGQTVLAETLSAQDVCQATTCSYMPDKPFANGRYTWKVLTKNALGSGPWSETLAFEVDAVETGVKIYIPFLFRP